MKTVPDSIWCPLSYMFERRRQKKIETPFCMLKVERVFRNFFVLRFLFFIAFFYISWMSMVYNGIGVSNYTYTLLKKKLTSEKTCTLNSFSREKKKLFNDRFQTHGWVACLVTTSTYSFTQHGDFVHSHLFLIMNWYTIWKHYLDWFYPWIAAISLVSCHEIRHAIAIVLFVNHCSFLTIVELKPET